MQANLTGENSKVPERESRKRVPLRSLVREYCTLGSVRGVPGNRHPYRDLEHWRGAVQLSKYMLSEEHGVRSRITMLIRTANAVFLRQPKVNCTTPPPVSYNNQPHIDKLVS